MVVEAKRNLYIKVIHTSVYKMIGSLGSVLITKKDVIRANQEIGEEGTLHNEASLDFALHSLKQQKSWLLHTSTLTRSILLDHVFQDGNKRTAYALIASVLEYQGLKYDKERLYLAVLTITKKNITNVQKIMRLIKHGILF